MNHKKSFVRTVSTAVLILSTASTAPAVTINRIFVAEGETFPIEADAAGSAPIDTAGGGSLEAIFNTAADWWEQAILDDRTVAISYGWAPITSPTLATATVFTFLSQPTPFLGNIRFDNDGSSAFFVDATPNSSEEYTDFTETSEDLGGGLINTGRVYTGATGDASGRFDLLSIAGHEIGHSLGFVYIERFGPLTITVNDGFLPNQGTVIPRILSHTDNNVLPNTLMEPFGSRGERKLLSGVDILGTAYLARDQSVNLDPRPVPEPATMLLVSSALLSLLLMRRQKR